MRHVIINADDFGLSEGICNAIHALFENNAISSTSLMTAANDAVRIMKNNDVKKLLGVAGVHLQLTNGRPLAPLESVRSLIREGSDKFKSLDNAKNYVVAEVELEWRTQILTAQELLGGPPTHLDSHHGFHRVPELFDTYVKLANEFNIPMRGAVSGLPKERILKECVRASTAIVRDWTGRGLDASEFKRQLADVCDNNPGEVVEVVCHPGFNDEYLEKISGLSKARDNDFAVLMELADSGYWDNDKYQLISFKDNTDAFNRCN